MGVVCCRAVPVADTADSQLTAAEDSGVGEHVLQRSSSLSIARESIIATAAAVTTGNVMNNVAADAPTNVSSTSQEEAQEPIAPLFHTDPSSLTASRNGAGVSKSPTPKLLSPLLTAASSAEVRNTLGTNSTTTGDRDLHQEETRKYIEGDDTNHVGSFTSSNRSELPPLDHAMVASVNDTWLPDAVDDRERIPDILASTAMPTARPPTPPPRSLPQEGTRLPTAASLARVLDYKQPSALMMATMPPSPHLAVSSNAAVHSWGFDEQLSGTVDSKDRWSPAALETDKSHSLTVGGAPSSFTMGNHALGDGEHPSPSKEIKETLKTGKARGTSDFIALAHFHSAAITPGPLSPLAGGLMTTATNSTLHHYAQHSTLQLPHATLAARQTSLRAFHHQPVPNPLSREAAAALSPVAATQRGAVSFTTCDDVPVPSTRFVRVELHRTFEGSEQLASGGSFGVWSHDGAAVRSDAATPPRVYEITLPGFTSKDDGRVR